MAGTHTNRGCPSLSNVVTFGQLVGISQLGWWRIGLAQPLGHSHLQRGLPTLQTPLPTAMPDLSSPWACWGICKEEDVVVSGSRMENKIGCFLQRGSFKGQETV